MRQQDLGNAVAIQARLLLQFAEEACHAFGIEAGRGHRLDTDAVGFLLMRTRVADLALVVDALADCQRAQHPVRLGRTGVYRRDDPTTGCVPPTLVFFPRPATWRVADW